MLSRGDKTYPYLFLVDCCMTAVKPFLLSYEILHLKAGFLLLYFRHVGTLWMQYLKTTLLRGSTSGPFYEMILFA